jgi:hypothetical protein
VYDWDMDGGHDFIGDCTTTLEELAEGEGFQILQVIYIYYASLIITLFIPSLISSLMHFHYAQSWEHNPYFVTHDRHSLHCTEIQRKVTLKHIIDK